MDTNGAEPAMPGGGIAQAVTGTVVAGRREVMDRDAAGKEERAKTPLRTARR